MNCLMETCARCKKKVLQKDMKSLNHCADCAPLVSARWQMAMELRDQIMKICEDFANGKDLEKSSHA